MLFKKLLSCETIRIVPVYATSALSRISIVSMSKSLVGSSKTNRFAGLENIFASISLFFSPPESEPICVITREGSKRKLCKYPTTYWRPPLTFTYSEPPPMNSKGVCAGLSSPRSWSKYAVASFVPSTTSPESGLIIPSIVFKRVVLPMPLRPIIPILSPR